VLILVPTGGFATQERINPYYVDGQQLMLAFFLGRKPSKRKATIYVLGLRWYKPLKMNKKTAPVKAVCHDMLQSDTLSEFKPYPTDYSGIDIPVRFNCVNVMLGCRNIQPIIVRPRLKSMSGMREKK